MTWSHFEGKARSAQQSVDYLKTLKWIDWKPVGITLHNTASPTLKQWAESGSMHDARIRNLESYYENDLGWHAGPHWFISRDWINWFSNPLLPGVHSRCWNATRFGIEMVGDYNVEEFNSGDGAKVRDLAVFWIATLNNKFGFKAEDLTFHVECPRDNHDCPGHKVVKADVIARVKAKMAELSGSQAPSPSPPSISLGDEVPVEEVLRRGAAGDLVKQVQGLLGIIADGDFGPATQDAVKALQTARGLLADGVVGPQTWAALRSNQPGTGITPPVAVTPVSGALPLAAIEAITALAAGSTLARRIWLVGSSSQERAPIGYVKGMAVMFGQLYYDLLRNDPVATAIAVPAGNASHDALAYYAPQFAAMGTNNLVAGVNTLRNLINLMIGLGMRESSGRYPEGQDSSAPGNRTSDRAEAGMFQMSWDAHDSSPFLPQLLAQYSAPGQECYRSIFAQGVTPGGRDLVNYGSGDGLKFQELAKACPAFTVKAAAVGLRVLRSHWGPINSHAAKSTEEADELLKQIQTLIERLPR